MFIEIALVLDLCWYQSLDWLPTFGINVCEQLCSKRLTFRRIVCVQEKAESLDVTGLTELRNRTGMKGVMQVDL